MCCWGCRDDRLVVCVWAPSRQDKIGVGVGGRPTIVASVSCLEGSGGGEVGKSGEEEKLIKCEKWD